MNLRELLLEKIERTGKADTAVIGWGRGMGHKGHMYLASSVITHAKELGGDPYFVVSRTVGKDDPITPEEKLAIYRKVFPKQGHIFQTATDEIPDLTRVLTNLNQQGYRNAVVIVGADQVKAFQYLKQYNGKPDRAGNIAFTFDNLDVISRQETNDPSRGEEGPRATPMRQVLMDPTKSDAEQFAVWRDAMNPEISDEEVRVLMNKAKERMMAMAPAPKATKKAPAKKKEEPLSVAAETIEKHGSQYRLVSKHGHKNLGTYPTKAGAEKRERQVQYFKHAGEGVEEGIGDTIKRSVKNIKRGMQGWDKANIGPGGEELGNPKDIVRRNKGYDDDTVKRLHKASTSPIGFPFRQGDFDGKDKHSPGGLQKRVLDREMKKRGLGKEDVAEGKGYKIDRDDLDDFTPDEIERIKDSHFPDTLRDNLRAAKKRRAKQDYLDKLKGSDDGSDSNHITPVGHSSDNTYEGVAEDWQKVNKSDKTDGMSKKAVSAYRRENPGSKLKTAVTKKPSELKAGSKDAKRRKSFCARMSGVDGPMKDEKGRPTAKSKALSRWNCNEDVENPVIAVHGQRSPADGMSTEYLQSVVNGQAGRPLVSVDTARQELQARANGKQQTIAPAPSPAVDKSAPRGSNLKPEVLQQLKAGTYKGWAPKLSPEEIDAAIAYQAGNTNEATSAAVRLGKAIQRTQGKTAASQARSVIPSSIPKKEVPKVEPKKVNEAAYPGNVGIMELIKFFNKAKEKDPELVAKVKQLIADHEDKLVWDIIQKYTGVKLQGKEFNESISESIKKEAARLRKLNEAV